MVVLDIPQWFIGNLPTMGSRFITQFVRGQCSHAPVPEVVRTQTLEAQNTYLGVFQDRAVSSGIIDNLVLSESVMVRVPGIIAITLSWLITLFSLWQLVELHEVQPGKRYDRYPELGQHAFGPKRGYWIVMPQQTTVQVATNIVYMVTGGKSLKKSIDLAFSGLKPVRQTYFILFFGALQLIISQTPNFNSLKLISILAAVMSFSYSGIAFVTSILKGTQHHQYPRYGVRGHSTADIIFDVFNGLGTIPSTPSRPSSKPMWRGVVVAYLIVAFCYYPVALSGFWAFGDLVQDDVLVSLERPPFFISIANLMVFAMPIFDAIECYLVQKLQYTPGHRLRLIARSAYV
ncbi:hypothetical protein IFM89_037080, partial [Coptis chinensis]